MMKIKNENILTIALPIDSEIPGHKVTIQYGEKTFQYRLESEDSSTDISRTEYYSSDGSKFQPIHPILYIL